jgi:hypothetical protein
MAEPGMSGILPRSGFRRWSRWSPYRAFQTGCSTVARQELLVAIAKGSASKLVPVFLTNEAPRCDLVGSDDRRSPRTESARYPGHRLSVGAWLQGTRFAGVSK